MVEHFANQNPLDAVFRALGDATRRQMLQALAEGERTVSELADPFEMSLAAASKHIKSLESAGLLQREIRGRTHVCRLNPQPLAQAGEWMRFYERFWGGRLDELERLLQAPAIGSPPSSPTKGTPE